MHFYRVKPGEHYARKTLIRTGADFKGKRVLFLHVKCTGPVDPLSKMFPTVRVASDKSLSHVTEWVRAADLAPWGETGPKADPPASTDYQRHVTRDALKTLRGVSMRVDTLPESNQVRLTLAPWQVGVIAKALALEEATNRNAAP